MTLHDLIEDAILRYFRVEPYTETDRVLAHQLADNIVRRIDDEWDHSADLRCERPGYSAQFLGHP